MASDLRMVVAVLRTIHEIERTGDLMVNVAKTTRRLYPVELPDPIRRIIEQMGHQAARSSGWPSRRSPSRTAPGPWPSRTWTT